MTEKKKNIFDKAIDALTNRDEKAAAEKAAADAKVAAEKAAADRAAADKAAAAKAAADQVTALKAAADKTAADKAAAIKAQADKAAAIAKENAATFAAGQAAFAKIAADKAAAAEKAAQPKKGIVNVKSLRIRKDHNTTSEVVAGLVAGNEVLILETWVDGKDVWAKLGPDQWAAMEYDGQTLIQYLDQ